MPFTNLNDILKKKFGGGLGKQMSDAMICDAFDRIVHEMWDGRFDGHVKAKFVRDGALMAGVDHSFYAQEIRTRQAEILEGIGRSAPANQVRTIIFSLQGPLEESQEYLAND